MLTAFWPFFFWSLCSGSKNAAVVEQLPRSCEDSKHPQEAAEGSEPPEELSSRTDRVFVESAEERNLSESLEPGWFHRDRERRKPNLHSLGESIPEECAFSSSPVLIVNHVTERKKKT